MKHYLILQILNSNLSSNNNKNLINKLFNNHIIDALVNITVDYLRPEEAIVQRKDYSVSFKGITQDDIFHKETRINGKLNGITKAYGYFHKYCQSFLGSEIINGKEYLITCIVYFENNKLHRKDGPAILYRDNSKSWYLNGKLHREDAPAIILSSSIKLYYLEGEALSAKELSNAVTKYH